MPIVVPDGSLPLSGGTLTGLLTIGSGDAQSIFVATTPQSLDAVAGTAASPNASVNPLVKAERVVSIANAAITGDGGEQLAAVLGITSGDANNQVQTVGVYGGAKDAGTAGGGGSPDAAGVYGLGRVTGSGIGVALGGFFNGRRDTNTAKASGVQVAVTNQTVTAGTYLSSGFSSVTGIWVIAAGTAQASVALSIGNPNNTQFDVGIAVTSQGAGGPVLNSSFRDDSSSLTSIDIRGTHTTAAISVAAGAGKVGIGIAAAAGSYVFIKSDADTDTALTLRANSATQSVNILRVESSSGVELVSVGSTGNLRIIDVNVVLGTVTGTRIGTATTQKLSFYNSTPIVQPSTTGTTAGFTAGAGTAVVSGSTFTGNTGATAYTIGDIVNALKLLGLMAA